MTTQTTQVTESDITYLLSSNGVGDLRPRVREVADLVLAENAHHLKTIGADQVFVTGGPAAEYAVRMNNTGGKTTWIVTSRPNAARAFLQGRQPRKVV